jgi:uncharacterized protein
VHGSRLDLSLLSFQSLTKKRTVALTALRALSRNLKASTGALGLSAAQRFEIDRNRVVSTSPTMPAIDRFTGVLFDALDAESLSPRARAFTRDHVVIHSALFGLLGAGDPIPAYRLSHDSRLPTLRLKAHWSAAIASELEKFDGLVIDLRSDGYVALGPAPARENSVCVRVVTEEAGGQRRALNHFNKKGKGEFVRALVESGVYHDSVESLLQWADSSSIRLLRGSQGTLDLVV